MAWLIKDLGIRVPNFGASWEGLEGQLQKQLLQTSPPAVGLGGGGRGGMNGADLRNQRKWGRGAGGYEGRRVRGCTS